MQVLVTERLVLRHLEEGDGAFLVDLLNQPSFLRYIGDKKVRTEADAARYVREGPQASYDRHGFGLYLVEERETQVPLGICGLVRREGLDHPDLGYAFLPGAEGKGYALEAGRGVLDHARALGLSRLLAVVTPDNERSRRLLEALGFLREGTVSLVPGEPQLELYRRDD